MFLPVVRLKGWDESAHPRVPAGSDEGGEFTSGEGGGGGARPKPRGSPEIMVVMGYVSGDPMFGTSGHAEINGTLRRGVKPSEKVRESIASLDKLIAGSENLDRVLWRGDVNGITPLMFKLRKPPQIGPFGETSSPKVLREVGEKLTQHYKGTVFQDKGFVSTSTSSSLATQFGVSWWQGLSLSKQPGGLIRITGKTKALEVNKVVGGRVRRLNSDATGAEREHILPRGTKFKVTSVGFKKDSFGLSLIWNVEAMK